MNRSSWPLAMLTAVSALALAVSCSDDDLATPTTTSTSSVSTTTTPSTTIPIDVVPALLSPDDLGEGWSVTTMGDDDASIDGAITDAQQALLPRPELCDEAADAARNALQNLRWQAFRSLELEVDDPLRPPTDRTGHLVFLQQLLSSAPAEQQRITFDQLRMGFQQCLGDIPAGEEGPGRAETMSVPAVGDDRFGVLITFEEAGGWAEWRIHQVLVRDGPVLMSLMIGDIHSVDVEPYFTVAEIDLLITNAVEVLRSRRSP